MSQYIIQESTLTEIADAVRSKTGGQEEITVSNLADTIDTITTSNEAYQQGYNAGYAAGYAAIPRTLNYTWDEDELVLTIVEVQQ